MTVDLLTNIHRELDFHKLRLMELTEHKIYTGNNWIVEHKVLCDHLSINEGYATCNTRKEDPISF